MNILRRLNICFNETVSSYFRTYLVILFTLQILIITSLLFFVVNNLIACLLSAFPYFPLFAFAYLKITLNLLLQWFPNGFSV